MTKYYVIALLSGVFFLTACSTQTSPKIDNTLNQIDNTPEERTDNVVNDPKPIGDTNYKAKGLTVFPKELLAEKNIRFLDISNNSIKSLPSEIGELSRIETLNVSNNLLTGSLPAELRKMPSLKILNASNNNLTGIPAEIGQLKNLEKIDFSNNNIDSFPQEIANIKDNLIEFNIKNNNFSVEKIKELKDYLPKTLFIE